MDSDVEAFIEQWMEEHAGLLEEIVHLLGENTANPYGRAMHAYLQAQSNESHVCRLPNRIATGPLR